MKRARHLIELVVDIGTCVYVYMNNEGGSVSVLWDRTNYRLGRLFIYLYTKIIYTCMYKYKGGHVTMGERERGMTGRTRYSGAGEVLGNRR